MNWTPSRRQGGLIGLCWIILLLVIDGLLLWRVVAGKLNGWTFISAMIVLCSLPAMVLIGYWLYGLMRLSYTFDRNRVAIRTSSGEQIIPMSSVERIIDGRETELQVGRQSIFWPGYWIGRAQVEGVGLTLFYAVTPPQEQVLIVTPSVSYGLTVPDIEVFMDAFRAAQRLGPSTEVTQTSRRAAYINWPVWQDHLMHALLLGAVLLNLCLFAVLLFRYPRLPDRLPLHFDASGAVDRIASKQSVFVLPVIGAIILVVNGVIGAVLYHWQRMASYLSWGGSLVVQTLFFLALWNIVN